MYTVNPGHGGHGAVMTEIDPKERADTMPARCDGDKVKQKMKDAGLTMRGLIDNSTLSESTVRRILSDKEYTTSDVSLDLLAQALKCSPYDLLMDEEIEAMVQAETEQAVATVVEEAEGEPGKPYALPAALNIASYVGYIRQTTNALVDALTHSNNVWRNTAAVLFFLLLVAVVYFLWEIFNPQLGITSILWNVYSSATPPGVLATMPPV